MLLALDTKRKPYSILMSEAERHHIAQLAEPLGLSAPELIRTVMLSEDVEKKLLTIKKHHFDKQGSAKILAALGKSRIANNLNQIAKAIANGTLILSPDVIAQINEAYATIMWMRSLLIRQQGIKS